MLTLKLYIFVGGVLPTPYNRQQRQQEVVHKLHLISIDWVYCWIGRKEIPVTQQGNFGKLRQ